MPLLKNQARLVNYDQFILGCWDKSRLVGCRTLIHILDITAGMLSHVRRDNSVQKECTVIEMVQTVQMSKQKIMKIIFHVKSISFCMLCDSKSKKSM